MNLRATAPRSGARALSYSWTHRTVEITAILGATALAVEAALRVVHALDDTTLVWVFVGGVVTGYVGADLVTGLVHWAADTYGSEQTPWLGRNFIAPFRRHHTDPEDITHHDFIETNGNTCIGAVFLLGAGFGWLPAPARGAGWFFAWTVVLATVAVGVATNQFHKWAHMAAPPTTARVLQRLGVILSREHHAVHHVAPYRTYYCITTGWMNRPLQKARVHETLEWLLAQLVVRARSAAGAVRPRPRIG